MATLIPEDETDNVAPSGTTWKLSILFVVPLVEIATPFVPNVLASRNPDVSVSKPIFTLQVSPLLLLTNVNNSDKAIFLLRGASAANDVS